MISRHVTNIFLDDKNSWGAIIQPKRLQVSQSTINRPPLSGPQTLLLFLEMSKVSFNNAFCNWGTSSTEMPILDCNNLIITFLLLARSPGRGRVTSEAPSALWSGYKDHQLVLESMFGCQASHWYHNGSITPSDCCVEKLRENNIQLIPYQLQWQDSRSYSIPSKFLTGLKFDCMGWVMQATANCKIDLEEFFLPVLSTTTF